MSEQDIYISEDKRKRLLFVNHNSDLIGGSNDEFIRLLKYFSSFKDKYYIFGLFPEGPNADNFSRYCDESDTYTCAFFPVTNKNLLHYAGFFKIFFLQKKEIKRVLDKREFDLCIFNVVVMFWIMRWVKKKKIKSLIFIREMVVPDFVRKIYYKRISDYGDYFISVSDQLEKDFISITGKTNIKTLYSSIEKELNYESNSESVKAQILDSEFKNIILSDKPKFINVGTIDDRKNQIMILESAKIIKDKLKDEMPYFIFIGDDLESPYGHTLRSFIENNKLGDRCYLMGQKDKIFLYNIYSHMSGMIISSKSEGLPLVLAEALRFGLPLISTNPGGITDIIKNGYNGIIIDQNKESLARAIIQLTHDKELYSKIKVNGYKSYKENFNLEKNLADIDKIIEKLVFI